ncbi:MAG: exodeoxyribonuclease VII large subunit [Oscillospiraceae bacterium]|nr:exodeoxyribonuclease VII large subunit [Oscillospiraceae bacterium]
MSILTISQLNRYVAFRLKEDKAVQNILVRGEISNFTHHARSGHCYFTLKDSECAVKAVMFRSYAERIKFRPNDGMHIIAAASASIYERDGSFQLYVTDMQEDGIGQQQLNFEKLKQKLSEMGVFDPAAKRPVPSCPGKVGVVTSGTGAALQDIINVIGRRYPLCELHVFPAQVQGEAAPESIAGSIARAERFGCDVLIVGRGGGSAEDLSAFNTERVVMAVYNCSVPVISAVGHETDVSLTDAAADLRAPTPSAAAELAVPSADELAQAVKRETRLLKQVFEKNTEQLENRLQRLAERLAALSPEQRQKAASRDFEILSDKLHELMKSKIQRCENSLQKELVRLDALSPLKILNRGYALVYKDSSILHSAEDADEGDELYIKLGSGQIHVKVLDRKEDTDEF